MRDQTAGLENAGQDNVGPGKCIYEISKTV